MGAVHDCTSTTCAPTSAECCPFSSSTCDAYGEYIMNPASGSRMTRFSPCTIGAVCSRLGSGQVSSDCLVDSRTVNTTGETGSCGNGIIEPGEACDCGRNACSDQDAKCCDSLTCQWSGGSQCTRGGLDGGNNDGARGPSNNDSYGSSSWWSEHYREVIIGLCAGIGGSVLLMILVCLIASCRRGIKRIEPVGKVAHTG